EFSYYNRNDQKCALEANGPNGVSFRSSAEQFHLSYMIGNDQLRYQTAERIKQAAMATGYRFRLIAAESSDSEVILRVRNDGVAPIYRDAYFAVGMQRSTTSLRGLLPGDTLTCTVKTSRVREPITIQSDAVLSTQTIQFDAEL
ncbi:MAG: DUF4832 domain-containing protein, partial [Planctomycetota bacterium]